MGEMQRSLGERGIEKSILRSSCRLEILHQLHVNDELWEAALGLDQDILLADTKGERERGEDGE